MRVETPENRGEERGRESVVAISTTPVTIVIQYILDKSSSDCAKDKLSCANMVHFCLIVLETYYNQYPIHLILVFLPTLYKFIVLGLGSNPVLTVLVVNMNYSYMY